MAQHRYEIPAEIALSALADASAAASGLFQLDAWIEHQNRWLDAVKVGLPPGLPEPSEEDKEVGAKHNALMERTRALRRDLTEFAADAEAALPPEASRANEIIREPTLPPLAPPRSRDDLLVVSRQFARGIADSMREATRALRPLRDRLRRHAKDEASLALAEAAHEFIVGVHGEERA